MVTVRGLPLSELPGGTIFYVDGNPVAEITGAIFFSDSMCELSLLVKEPFLQDKIHILDCDDDGHAFQCKPSKGNAKTYMLQVNEMRVLDRARIDSTSQSVRLLLTRGVYAMQ